MPNAPDPLPVTLAQLRALVAAAFRELRWVLPSVTEETRRWRARAESIPTGPLRTAALTALSTKRGHTDGAAMFSILLPRRQPGLLRLLVAYELIWDFLDTTHESAPTERNGRQLHLALVDAVEITRPVADYYRYHPWSDDAGYLHALVATCRHECAALPSYPLVRTALVREAWRAQVLALNHIPTARERDMALRAWVKAEFPVASGIAWFELSGAASASLVVHALFALAANPACTCESVDSTYHAYWPWISLATTMLDSYADTAEDRTAGNHSYIAHYPSRATAVARILHAIEQSAQRAGNLPHGPTHRVIVACMIALYLSKDSVRTGDTEATTLTLLRGSGALVQLVAPVLRWWRIHYHHESA